MPNVTINIGQRDFTVSCREGEEQYLHTAAKMLDTEATSLIDQIGRLPESRMLLMAGLMLADRTASYEERARVAEARVAELEHQLEEAAARPAPEPARVEVPVIPVQVGASFEEIAARAEALAAQAEDRAATGD